MQLINFGICMHIKQEIFWYKNKQNVIEAYIQNKNQNMNEFGIYHVFNVFSGKNKI